MILKLVRHGESRANTGEMNPLEVGDQRIPLTERGELQAQEAGRKIGEEFFRQSLIYTSPYLRARQTLSNLIRGANLPIQDPPGRPRVYEDPRLREVDHGYSAPDWQHEMRKIHGWFYYRFSGGESPADCFDRTSIFLEGMMRQVQRKGVERVLIVSHGLTLRCFLMRYLHLSVEQFEGLANPSNCDIITIGRRESMDSPQFCKGKWGVTGLRFHDTTAWPGVKA